MGDENEGAGGVGKDGRENWGRGEVYIYGGDKR